MERRVFLIIVAAVIIAALIFSVLLNNSKSSPKERACINSGGTITIILCCGSAGDFPNSCTMGLCGCSLEASHEVKSCNCGENKCFNSSICVEAPLQV